MTMTRRLGAAALLLGVTAPLVGSPYNHSRGRIDIAGTVRRIDEGGDHVSALQLAQWIRDRKPGLRVIDVRDALAFTNDAIPTAENLPIEQLVRQTFAPHETLVLYSEGGAHAGQAWVLLQALGVANAYFIAGGLADWYDEVLAPVLAVGATPDQVRAFETVAELSRYFGGTPRTGEMATAIAGPAQPRRRGC